MRGILIKGVRLLARQRPRSYNVRCLSLSGRKLQESPLNATAVSALGYTDYETERKNFKLTVPEYYNFAADVIDQWALKEKKGARDNVPAFWWVDSVTKEEVKWSFRELSDMSKRVARVLVGPCGVKAGDRVIVILPRVPQWWLINIAAIRIGAVLIPGTTQLTKKDIQKRIEKSQATAVIVDFRLVDKVQAALKDTPGNVKSRVSVCPDNRDHDHVRGWMDFTSLYNLVDSKHKCFKTKSEDPMQIYFTSGTTGEPKMAEMSHAAYGLGHTITGRYWLDLVPSDIHWSQSDTGWAKAAWSNLFAPWIQGACVFVYNAPKYDAVETLRILRKYPVTTFCSAPTAYRYMVQESEADLSVLQGTTLRHCVSAGEPLSPEVIEKWYEGTGHLVREGYGQTETVLQCCTSRYMVNKPGSMGKPPPGMDVHVINDDNEECAVGEEGEIAVKVSPERPVGIFTRYIDDPERTASSYRGEYYLSGDRAYRDEDGYLWFVGRSDDVIISSGYRIGPFEVESALIEHEAVAESAVVSSPDEERGAVVKAFVTLKEEYVKRRGETLVQELQQHVQNITAPYKYPRKIEFIEFLPKTVSGKIRRVELRNKEWKKATPEY